MTYRYSSGRATAASLRTGYVLSDDEIARVAPSVFATEAHGSQSDRYTFISTAEVLNGLRKEGFQPFEVAQTRVKDQSKREFTRHMLRLRHPDHVGDKEASPELVLLNSHDGSSSYQLMAGFFRFVCSNGLIAGDVTNDVRVRHYGDVVGNVIEGSYTVMDNLAVAEDRIDTYRRIQLTAGEQLAFAEAAADLKWDRNESGNLPVEPSRLLVPRRWADRQQDLWSTFNMAQEHLLKGGVRTRSATGRRIASRAVGSVNENIRLNRSLWTLADQMARIKTGEALAA